MPRVDNGFPGKGHEFCVNTRKKDLAVSSRQIPAPDASSKKNIPTEEFTGLIAVTE